jgi:hypothetical protein
MTFDDYLLHMFCLIDDQLKALTATLPHGRLRLHGPEPVLSDSEVITMEVAGEFLGLDADKAIYAHFRRYHLREFPALARVGRTTFARQAANPWRAKQLLHERVFALVPLHEDPLWLIDSFPLHVCRFARAKGCKLFAGQASFGHDHVGRQTYYGFRVHLRDSDEGPVGQVVLAAANVSDLAAAGELAPPEGGVGIGDRNYHGKDRQADLARLNGFVLLAPYKSKARDPDPARSKLLTRARRLVETVIGQLADRYHCKATKARDLWHLCSRVARKFLSHTASVLLNIRAGNPPLQLERLVQV